MVFNLLTEDRMQGNTVTIGRVVGEGWRCFKARPWFWIGIVILYGVISEIIGFASSAIPDFAGRNSGSVEIAYVLIVVFFLLNIYVSTRMAMGLVWMGLTTVDGKTARVRDLFAKPHLFWRYLLATVLYGLMVMVGMMLLIVPGVYLAARFLPLNFVLIERETGIAESFQQAQRLTEGHRGKLIELILLGLSLFLGTFVVLMVSMAVLGELAPLVLPLIMMVAVLLILFLGTPIISLSLASLYRALRNASVDPAATA